MSDRRTTYEKVGFEAQLSILNNPQGLPVEYLERMRTRAIDYLEETCKYYRTLIRKRSDDYLMLMDAALDEGHAPSVQNLVVSLPSITKSLFRTQSILALDLESLVETQSLLNAFKNIQL